MKKGLTQDNFDKKINWKQLLKLLNQLAKCDTIFFVIQKCYKKIFHFN